MSNDMVCLDFGKDIRLIGEVTVTGNKAGANRAFWVKLAHDKELFRQVVEQVLNYSKDAVPVQAPLSTPENPLTVSQQIALAIMGIHMLLPSDVETHFNVRYSDEERRALDVIPWTPEELLSCRDTHILFPGYPISHTEVYGQVPEAFMLLECWDHREPFANQEKVSLAWHLVRKDVLPDSTEKIWDEQVKFVPANEHIVDDPTAVFMIVLYFRTKKTWLFSNHRARTSSVSSVGGHVCLLTCLNIFGRQITVNIWDDDNRGAGLLCARNPSKP
jgi:hypothetical protein